MATLKEAARRAGVSVGTVSNVLKDTARVSDQIRQMEDWELRCPEDIALATFDDLPLTEVFHPHLPDFCGHPGKAGAAFCDALEAEPQEQVEGAVRRLVSKEPARQ